MKQTLYFKEKEIPVEHHHLYGEWQNIMINPKEFKETKPHFIITRKEISDHCDKEIERFKRETK